MIVQVTTHACTELLHFFDALYFQLLPIERAAKKEKKQKEILGLDSDGEDDDDEEEEEEEDDRSDADMDEEDTVQTNIDDMDQFRLPGAEEREKEGE